MMPTTTTTTTTTNSTTATTSISNSQDTGGMQVPTPEHFICSISGEIFKDPVIASDGQTYERESIEKWIATKEGQPVRSPLTGAILNNHMLTPNHSMKSMICTVCGPLNLIIFRYIFPIGSFDNDKNVLDLIDRQYFDLSQFFNNGVQRKIIYRFSKFS